MFESKVSSSEICLGYQGEHLARKLIFDVSETINNFSDKGTFSILNLRSGESTPYYIDGSCCVYKAETKELEWIITGIETDVFGAAGKCEIHYVVDGKTIKPGTYNTIVHEGLGEAGARPNSTQSWVNKVTSSTTSIELAIKELEALITRAEQLSEDAKNITTKPPYIGENGTWWVWDVDQNAYVDSGKESFTADAVRYQKIQDLTDKEKEQARANIGAGTSDFSGRFSDLIDVPEDTNFGDLITETTAAISRSKSNEREVIAFRSAINGFDFLVSDPYPNANGLREVSLAVDFDGKVHTGKIVVDNEFTINDNIRINQLTTDQKIPRYLSGNVTPIDFVRIRDKYIDMVNAVTDGSSTELYDSDNKPLYWAQDITNCDYTNSGYPAINGTQVSITTINTGFPVKVYNYTETKKLSMFLDGDNAHNPHIVFGESRLITEEGSHIVKTKDGFEVYNFGSNGEKKGMFIGDRYVDFAGIRKPTEIIINRAELKVGLEGGYGYTYKFGYNDNGDIISLTDSQNHVIRLDVGREE